MHFPCRIKKTHCFHRKRQIVLFVLFWCQWHHKRQKKSSCFLVLISIFSAAVNYSNTCSGGISLKIFKWIFEKRYQMHCASYDITWTTWTSKLGFWRWIFIAKRIDKPIITCFVGNRLYLRWVWFLQKSLTSNFNYSNATSIHQRSTNHESAPPGQTGFWHITIQMMTLSQCLSNIWTDTQRAL